MKGVADQTVAEKDGRNVALGGADRRLTTTFIRLVQNIIVNQRGDVDHFDDSGKRVVRRGRLARRRTAEQQQCRTQHLATIGPRASTKLVDEREVAYQFVIEDLLCRV